MRCGQFQVHALVTSRLPFFSSSAGRAVCHAQLSKYILGGRLSPEASTCNEPSVTQKCMLLSCCLPDAMRSINKAGSMSLSQQHVCTPQSCATLLF